MAQTLPLGDYFFRRIPIFLKLSIFHSNIVYNNCITVPNISAEKKQLFYSPIYSARPVILIHPFLFSKYFALRRSFYTSIHFP